MSLSTTENEKVSNFVEFFTGLPGPAKDETVRRIVEAFGPRQLYLFTQQLESQVVKRDFLKWLPSVIVCSILSFLDLKTVCACLEVSKSWYNTVGKDNGFWKRQCQSVGIAAEPSYFEARCLLGATQCGLRMTYLAGCKSCESLRTYCATSSRPFRPPSSPVDIPRISALDFRENMVACGSLEGAVAIHEMPSMMLVNRFTASSCSSVKLLQNNGLLLGSYQQSIELWNWQSGVKLVECRGHLAAVLSINVDDTAKLAVSSSSDGYVCVWSLESGSRLFTTMKHEQWIAEVAYIKQEVKGATFILGVSSSAVHIKVWSSKLEFVRNLPAHGTCPAYSPRLALSNGYIACGSTSGIHVWSQESFDLLRVFSRWQCSLALDIGSSFLTVFNRESTSLDVININTGKTIALLHLVDVCVERQHKLISFSSSGWMDGLKVNEENTFRLFVAQPNQRLCTYFWQDQETTQYT